MNKLLSLQWLGIKINSIKLLSQHSSLPSVLHHLQTKAVPSNKLVEPLSVYRQMFQNHFCLCLFTSLLLLSPRLVQAQIYTGDIALTSQAEVNAFSYTEVIGGLSISGSDITDLTPLANLTKVGRYLHIYSNSNLSSLEGLQNLASVGESLDILHNAKLSSLEGLQNLKSVGGYLSINGNPTLSNLKGLENLKSVGGWLIIFDNFKLSSLDGLQNLTSVLSIHIKDNNSLSNIEGLQNITSVRNLFIYDNPQLSQCSLLLPIIEVAGYVSIQNNATNCNSPAEIEAAFCKGDVTLTTQAQVNAFNCSEVNGDLTISGSDITDLTPLANLTKVGRYLRIENNPILSTLAGLEKLTQVEAYLYIGNNHTLSSIAGLQNLASVGAFLEIVNNNNLNSLVGLDNLVYMGGYLRIKDNATLISLASLQGLTLVNDFLDIVNNDMLSNLSGLQNISSVQRFLRIQGNATLISLESLEKVSSIGENLFIEGNEALGSMMGLKNLESIGRDFYIGNNNNLSSLVGFEKPIRVGGYFQIVNNNNLSNLKGLENIKTVAGNFAIGDNANLISLQGLEKITHIGADLYILRNPQLSQCCLLLPLIAVTQGSVTIQNNATNCNSPAQIVAACTPVVVDQSVTTDEDVAKTITLADSDELTYEVVTAPVHGTLTGSGASRTYTPAANFFGTDSFTFTISNGTLNSNTATVTITVNAVNDVPVAANDSYPTAEDTPLTISAPGVLNSDTDIEGDNLTAILVTGPSHGTLTFNADGSYTYSPALNYNGPDTFTYKAQDAANTESNVASVDITVNAINDAPSFTKGANQTVSEDAGPQTVSGWSTNISKGAANESAQTIDFIVTNNNNGLFSTQPAIDYNGNLIYTPAANALGLATVSVTLQDDGGIANGGDNRSGIQTFTITVTAVNDAPEVTATLATQQVQYSDGIATVTVAARDVDNALHQLSATSSWKVGALSFASGLPGSLALTKITDGSWSLSSKMMVAPGTYTIRVKVSDGTADGNSNSAYTDIILVVAAEDARITYTGALFASTSGTTSGKATVTLSATIQDITALTGDPAYDVYAGEIRNARVKFVNRDNGSDISGWLTPGLVTSTDLKTGTVTFNWAIDIGSKSYETFTIGIVVNNYYTRNASLDNTTINVSKPLNDFITGGGFITLTTASGLIQPQQGSKNNFGFNVKFNKGGTNLQGNINTIIRSKDGKVYQVKGNVMTSLSVNSTNKTAVFNGKANIQDITNPLAPLSVDGNATLQVNMTDMGEPGSSDKIGITVWNKDGGLWFASTWDGAKTVEKALAGGNILIRGASRARMDFENTNETEPSAQVNAYPNPVLDKVTIDLGGIPAMGVKTLLTDAVGKPLLENRHKVVGESLLEIDMSGLKSAMYIIQLRSERANKIVKVIKQ